MHGNKPGSCDIQCTCILPVSVRLAVLLCLVALELMTFALEVGFNLEDMKYIQYMYIHVHVHVHCMKIHVLHMFSPNHHFCTVGSVCGSHMVL